MDFGMLDFNKTVNWYWDNTWNHRALLNVGDAAEYLVVEQLYQSVGINIDQVVRLSIPELVTYRGKKITVALNIAFDSYIGYNYIFDHMSPDIHPLFLGISLTNTNLNSEQMMFLKDCEPIGCRDQRTYDYLRQSGVRCYLNGCTASVLKLPEGQYDKNLKNKTLFVDVPLSMLEYVPKEKKENIVFLNQELYCTRKEFPANQLPSHWAENVMREYTKGYMQIYTSRFHGAVLALACGMPTAVTLEKYTFRFSWIQNYCPIYTEESASQIVWKLKKQHYCHTAKLICEIAQKRLRGGDLSDAELMQLTELQLTKEIHQETNQVLYYKRVMEEIQKIWSTDTPIQFAFWGINDNAIIIQNELRKKFPNAELVEIYDMFKPIEYQGLIAKNPRELASRATQKNFYVIVTAYLASRVAGDVFVEAGFPSEKAFLCHREFIKEPELQKL